MDSNQPLPSQDNRQTNYQSELDPDVALKMLSSEIESANYGWRGYLKKDNEDRIKNLAKFVASAYKVSYDDNNASDVNTSVNFLSNLVNLKKETSIKNALEFSESIGDVRSVERLKTFDEKTKTIPTYNNAVQFLNDSNEIINLTRSGIPISSYLSQRKLDQIVISQDDAIQKELDLKWNMLDGVKSAGKGAIKGTASIIDFILNVPYLIGATGEPLSNIADNLFYEDYPNSKAEKLGSFGAHVAMLGATSGASAFQAGASLGNILKAGIVQGIKNYGAMKAGYEIGKGIAGKYSARGARVRELAGAVGAAGAVTAYNTFYGKASEPMGRYNDRLGINPEDILEIDIANISDNNTDLFNFDNINKNNTPEANLLEHKPLVDVTGEIIESGNGLKTLDVKINNPENINTIATIRQNASAESYAELFELSKILDDLDNIKENMNDLIVYRKDIKVTDLTQRIVENNQGEPGLLGVLSGSEKSKQGAYNFVVARSSQSENPSTQLFLKNVLRDNISNITSSFRKDFNISSDYIDGGIVLAEEVISDIEESIGKRIASYYTEVDDIANNIEDLSLKGNLESRLSKEPIKVLAKWTNDTFKNKLNSNALTKILNQLNISSVDNFRELILDEINSSTNSISTIRAIRSSLEGVLYDLNKGLSKKSISGFDQFKDDINKLKEYEDSLLKSPKYKDLGKVEEKASRFYKTISNIQKNSFTKLLNSTDKYKTLSNNILFYEDLLKISEELDDPEITKGLYELRSSLLSKKMQKLSTENGTLDNIVSIINSNNGAYVRSLLSPDENALLNKYVDLAKEQVLIRSGIYNPSGTATSQSIKDSLQKTSISVIPKPMIQLFARTIGKKKFMIIKNLYQLITGQFSPDVDVLLDSLAKIFANKSYNQEIILQGLSKKGGK